MRQPTLYFENHYDVSIKGFNSISEIDEFIEQREGIKLVIKKRV
jgi:hypothetical protein